MGSNVLDIILTFRASGEPRTLAGSSCTNDARGRRRRWHASCSMVGRSRSRWSCG